MPRIGGSPKRGISGTIANAHTIVAMLNIAGESAGMKKRRSELSMPIIATEAATVVRNGSITLRQRRRQLEFARRRRELAARSGGDRRGKDNPENDQARR